MTEPGKSIEERFFRFVAGYPRAELVDSLALTDSQRRSKKVDVFFDDRQLLAEVKSLEADVGPKIDRVLEPYRDRPDFPLFFGKWPIDEILKRLPEGEQLRQKLYEKISDRVAEIVADANAQVRVTKESFDLPSAHGLLIILNDSVAVLDPRVVAHRVAQTLSKRKPTGDLRYDEIGGVWILGEIHRIQLSPQLQGIPAVIMAHPVKPDDVVMQFLSDVQKPWATFAGLPLVEVPDGSFANLKFQLVSEHTPQPNTLSAFWRRRYGDDPYLSDFSDDDLVLYGARLIFEMSLIQQSAFPSKGALLRSIRRYGDLNEELNRRHIEVRLIRQRADLEGMSFKDSAEMLEITKVLEQACDERVES